MAFTVTYRAKDGAMREERVEAASRAECVAECRRRGIAPTKIAEGKTGKTGNSRDFGKSGNTGKIWIAIVAAFVIVVGGVWWFIWRDGAGKPKTASVQQQEEKKPRAEKPAKPKAEKPAQSAGAQQQVKPKKTKREKPVDGKTEAGLTREAGEQHQEAFTNQVVSDLRVDLSKAKPMFSNPVQAELANYIQPGRDVPPPDRVRDEDALKAAEEGVKYGPDDTEDVIAQKKVVEDLLMEMKEYINGGGHANDFFEKLQRRQELEGAAVQQIRGSVNALIDEGDEVGAAAALEKYNKYLEAKGIPPVRIKRLERAKARRAAGHR